MRFAKENTHLPAQQQQRQPQQSSLLDMGEDEMAGLGLDVSLDLDLGDISESDGGAQNDAWGGDGWGDDF